MANYSDSLTYSTASGVEGLQYVVLQVTLKEKFLGNRFRQPVRTGRSAERAGI